MTEIQELKKSLENSDTQSKSFLEPKYKNNIKIPE